MPIPRGPAALMVKSPKRGWIGLPGRVVVSWGMAGGLAAGGLLMALLTLTGQQSAGASFSTTTILFLLGAPAGLIHGGLLGYVGRPSLDARKRALGSLGLGSVMAIPGMVIAWLVALWVALSAGAVALGDFFLLMGVTVGWLAAGLICAWATLEGWRALRNALRRWPQYRLGTVVLLAILVVLIPTFLSERPEIWFTDVRVTGIGAVGLALGATIWIASPVVIVGLHLAHRGWALLTR